MNFVDWMIKFRPTSQDFPAAAIIGFLVGVGIFSIGLNFSFLNTSGQLLIAGLLAYIAYQNYLLNVSSSRVEKDKHRLELFDRRHRVFRATQELFKAFFQDGTVKQEHLHKFVIDSSDAEFLFESDLDSYLKTMRDKAIQMGIIRFRFEAERPMAEADRKKLAQEQFELSGWFIEEHKTLSDKFRKYLHFSIHQEV
jgi:hypothetical protein